MIESPLVNPFRLCELTFIVFLFSTQQMPKFDMKFYDKGGFQDEMTRSEAARTLGVGLSSPPDRVKDAHRRLMKILHPDNNGSSYLSTKVNEAKDMLLKKKKTGTRA